MKNKKNQTATYRDFSAEMLPHSRKALFSDCIRQRPDVFWKLSGVMMVSFLPVFIVNLFANMAYSNLVDTNINAAITLALYQIVAAIKIPCYICIGLGFAAISRVLRQLVWGEPVFLLFHLKIGLKQNGGRFAIVFALAGIIRLLCSFSVFFGESFIAYLPGLISAVLLLPIGLFMLSQTVIYDVTLSKSFSNGFALYFNRILPALGFAIAIYLIGNINLVPSILVRLILNIAATLSLPILALGWLIYSCHMFDQTINPIHYPEIVNKGLYRSNDAEEQ